MREKGEISIHSHDCSLHRDSANGCIEFQDAVQEIRVCREEILENAGHAHVADATMLSQTNERVTSEPIQIHCLPLRNSPLSQTCDVEELSSGIYNQAVFKVLDCKDDVVTVPKVQVRNCCLLRC
jgi:hypothetical protein